MLAVLRVMAVIFGFAGGAASAANTAEENAVAYVLAQVVNLEHEGSIWAALAKSNFRNMNLSSQEVLAQDDQWRREIGTGDPALIGLVTAVSASAYLRALVQGSGGRITEIIVMDALGLNAAISNVTTDYWQGDEAKFLETFPKGAGAIHKGGIEFDESANTYQRQVSVTLVDPITRTPVGAVTFGIDAAAFP
ncbi:hypothetical protein SAMN04488040_1087 [Sulfitobacter marinus]|uniref:Uncharacterized protein n=1 Tax=Sulfitobacter marinus TaxID=394264 RepID=A0A1I6QYV4_9RHOB|nr:hypothetical protein [Sulfitobacter marinus]SFS57603.1 hypothetical protein SAMN04488040_1087 [Sulfitobacter marinus]